MVTWTMLNPEMLADDLADRISILTRRAASLDTSQHRSSTLVRSAQSELVQQYAVTIRALTKARDAALAAPKYGWASAAGKDSSTLSNAEILEAYYNR